MQRKQFICTILSVALFQKHIEIVNAYKYLGVHANDELDRSDKSNQ